MRRKLIACGLLLLAGATAAPAGAHGGDSRDHVEAYPALPKGAQARALERRERAIERSALGNEHAMEHAEGRALVRDAQKAHAYPGATYSLGSGKFTQALQPTNDRPASTGGQWASSVALPVTAINAIQLHTGKILFFAYPWRATEPDPSAGADAPGDITNWDTADAYLFDPGTGRSRAVPPPINPDTGKRVELFCSGASLLADGRVLVTGGNVGNPAGDGPNKSNYGLNTTYTFDPVAAEQPGTNPWKTGPRMRQGRWYPTQTLLPDGRTVITSGQANGQSQPNNPTGVDGSGINRDIDVVYPDDTLERSSSRLDGANGNPPSPGQYPHQFWMPSGRLFTAGPVKTDTWAARLPSSKGAAAIFTDIPDLPQHREWAGGALIGDSKVLLIGGADRTDTTPPPNQPALASTTFYDEANPGAGWQAGPTLTSARAFANSVLLPDGKVAVVGGGTGDRNDTRYYRWNFTAAQKRVEILDPTRLGQGQQPAPVEGNAQAEGRTYHSTALLLPDGRVWSAGDDINGPLANPAPDPGGGPFFQTAQKQGGGSGVCRDTAELWSPPYLFNADGSARQRPVIVDAPASAAYGTRIGVRATGNVAKAVLVAPGATTHADDMSQRRVELAPPQSLNGRGVNVTLPAGVDTAPPGYYMLFLLDAQGTPSVARFIRLVNPGAPTADPDPLTAASPATAAQSQPQLSSPSTPASASTTSCTTLPPTTDPESTAPAAPAPETPASTPQAPPALIPAPGPDEPVADRLRVGVRLSLASTLSRLKKAKRFSAVVTTTRPATVRVSTAVEVRRRVRVKGSKRTRVRTVRLPVAAARTVRLKRAGSGCITVRLTKVGVRRLRALKSATLRITIKATPAKGKAVTVTRRPVLR